MKSAIAGEFEKLNESLHEIFDSEFDFKVNDTTIDAEKERKIHSKQKTSSSTSQSTTRDKPEESEDIVLPCDAEITPVKGVPAAKLSSGDKIFVDIGKVDSKDKKIKARLEATKDQKTDMVPTTIISKESSGPGKFRLKTQFADNVYGKVSCGNDVSIRVPEEVLNRYQNKSDGDIVAMLEENKMALAVGIGVIVFLVVAAWLFGLL